MEGWSFTTYERRAVALFVSLVVIASGVRYYQNRSLARRFEVWHAQSDSLAAQKLGSVPLQSFPLNLNKAGKRELERLPGIGPVLADRIIKWRESNGGFKSVEDLDRVKGIGKALMERVRGNVVVKSATP